MAKLTTTGIAIKGISAAVPTGQVNNEASPLLPEEKERQNTLRNIGIYHRRIAAPNTTAADLCAAAAEALLERLAWSRSEIQVLCLVTQTPDFITPATSILLQDKLGLSQDCLCFDINLGCSAFPYGLATVANFLQSMPGAKGLLLIGDKSSQLVSPTDKSTALLFSDAGSAVALENEGTDHHMVFHLFSDGSGYQSLMVPGGGG
ncbi:MAG: ketoacyl-ACP synthase III, partial [Lewinella sp.]|nr:ketoacyl-ACP synthase III [Lewinella sp.]